MCSQHQPPPPMFPTTPFPGAECSATVRLLVLVALTLALLAVVSPRSASADEPVTFGLRVMVAEVDGEPVVDEEWVAERIGWANRIFEPATIDFRQGSREPLAEEHADLISRSDRHALGPLVEGTLIHVFVVRSLANVDVDGDFIRGVHWRSRRGGDGPGGSRRHYVILSSIAGPTVLAHELGHFFGNPHSDTPGNIMSYSRGSGPPFFDRAQLGRIRRHRERFLRTRELVPFGAASSTSASTTK